MNNILPRIIIGIKTVKNSKYPTCFHSCLSTNSVPFGAPSTTGGLSRETYCKLNQNYYYKIVILYVIE
jgi:hypothetical protein